MRRKSVLPLVGLILVLGVQHVISESLLLDDHGECGFSSDEKDSCALYCYRSMKLGLAYITELKENIKILEENHLESESSQLSKAREENLAEQKNLRNKIEQILREKNTEIDGARNREIENLKEKLATQKFDLDKAIKDLESKNKELQEYQTKEKNSSNKIRELNTKISSLQKKLEESETHLTDSNHLLERQVNQTAKHLIECREKQPKPSCKGLSSGIHNIEIDPISVLCEGDLEGGGWIVIHKRFDGSVDFNRTWTEYRDGFGNKKGEFFIGLENLHRITNSQAYKLYVQLEYHNGTLQFARYSNFRIGNETTKYMLESLGGFKGTAQDLMKYSLKQAFTSFDQDNDRWKGFNCAHMIGAWWHRHCSWVNLNGKYFSREVDDPSSMSWWWWISFYDAISMSWVRYTPLKSVQMLVRPK